MPEHEHEHDFIRLFIVLVLVLFIESMDFEGDLRLAATFVREPRSGCLERQTWVKRIC